MENKEKVDIEPIISIVIPVYNEENYLKETINAVINQTYKNLEIIIVNDGSIDNSKKIIDYYASIDDRIKPIHKENSGVSNSRNVALDNVTGKYVCFMDADDYISKDYVSYLYKILKENEAEISLVPTPYDFTGKIDIEEIINSRDYLEKKSIRVINGKEATKQMLYYHIKISSWCKLISMDLINKYKIRFNPKLKCGEGFNFCTTCLQRAKKVAVGYKTIYFYRVDNPHSAMTKFNIDMIRNGIKAIKLIDDNLIERDEDLVKACHYAFWHTHCDFFNTMVGCKVKNKYPDDYKEIKRICRKNATCNFFSPISKKEKIKGCLYLISPYMTAKIINSFRLRKFTMDTDK